MAPYSTGAERVAGRRAAARDRGRDAARCDGRAVRGRGLGERSPARLSAPPASGLPVEYLLEWTTTTDRRVEGRAHATNDKVWDGDVQGSRPRVGGPTTTPPLADASAAASRPRSTAQPRRGERDRARRRQGDDGGLPHRVPQDAGEVIGLAARRGPAVHLARRERERDAQHDAARRGARELRRGDALRGQRRAAARLGRAVGDEHYAGRAAAAASLAATSSASTASAPGARARRDRRARGRAARAAQRARRARQGSTRCCRSSSTALDDDNYPTRCATPPPAVLGRRGRCRGLARPRRTTTSSRTRTTSRRSP